ncbi:MAG: fibrillarin-like rRNA/tRNA 2'-O-methyltransferase [Candidatus Diapherotrites archaeon]|nr:fibrillarin-like rRNA/tRNA 2'-O-methyltransferase [Candidatus Diapherotrites archaeon]
MREIFENVFSDGQFIYTKNLLPGEKVYGEKLVFESRIEFRRWDAFRSKLGAGLKNGLKELPIKKGSKVLYLGAAEGTTVSHISDIIENEGLLVGVDLSAVSMRRFVQLCEKRANIVPLLADALQVENYPEEIRQLSFDVLFQDVSQKNQAEIFLKNAQFLKEQGFGLLSVKARSISASEQASIIFASEASKLKKNFEILQTVRLEPFETDHALILCRKKKGA